MTPSIFLVNLLRVRGGAFGITRGVGVKTQSLQIAFMPAIVAIRGSQNMGSAGTHPGRQVVKWRCSYPGSEGSSL